MNLKQLGYFVAVAEELHFGRAAERLDMAQPPLSRQIKQLEDDLGAILFNRGRRAVSLTQAGERLLKRGRALIADLDDLRLEIRRLGQGAEGRLRIGFVGSSTYGILPNIIKSYRAHFPEVSLTLSPMNNAQLHRSLVQREIDIAFARPELGDAEFVTRHLQTEALIAAVPDTLTTRLSQTISLEEIAPHAVILYPEYPRPSYADLVLDGCAAQGLEITNRIFTMDLQTALSLVAIGEGICIVPASVGSAARNGLRYCIIEPSIGDTALSLNHRVDEQGQHVQAFVRIAQSVARKTF
ncbi:MULTISPECIES: LysR family transcriptional regulator [unclassified Mameliella]|uniref:LysR family transcriptional regulator n=1 Tax=unclassified Mameliella TaxID=2630630 RepID=UPI00273E7DBE|nr:MULTISPECIES: LysR family transcriptional regulator [unclassified Mameliella]